MNPQQSGQPINAAVMKAIRRAGKWRDLVPNRASRSVAVLKRRYDSDLLRSKSESFADWQCDPREAIS